MNQPQPKSTVSKVDNITKPEKIEITLTPQTHANLLHLFWKIAERIKQQEVSKQQAR